MSNLIINAELVIGIDPGATGALALYNVTTAQVLKVADMPHTQHVLTTKKKTKRVDGPALLAIIQKWIEYATYSQSKIVCCHIEKVQAFGKQSAPAAFNFGYAACWAEAICVALEINYKLISPVTWKRQFQLIASNKDAARLMVLENFPYLQALLRRKMDVDRADAVLLAVYKPRG